VVATPKEGEIDVTDSERIDWLEEELRRLKYLLTWSLQAIAVGDGGAVFRARLIGFLSEEVRSGETAERRQSCAHALNAALALSAGPRGVKV